MSVPLVTTMPARSSRAANVRLMRRASRSQSSSVSAPLATLENCSVSTTTCPSSAGTEAESSAAVRREPARLAIVPPVAISRTSGRSSGWAARAAGGGATSAANVTHAAIHEQCKVRIAPGRRRNYTESASSRCARASQFRSRPAASSGVEP